MTNEAQKVFAEFDGNAAVLCEALAKLRKASTDLVESSIVPADSSDTSSQECVWVLRLKLALRSSSQAESRDSGMRQGR